MLYMFLMDLIDLIPPARSLLGWSQSDLGNQAGMDQAAVARIENRKQKPQHDTLEALKSALEQNGVVFMEDGVRRPDVSYTVLSGPGWFVNLLDDARHTLQNHPKKELLIFGGNNSVSPPEVIEAFRRLRASGVTMREMVEQGDTWLTGPENEYRWIKSEFYKNYVTVIYANRVCNDFGDKGILIINEEWTETERNKFEMLWNAGLPVEGKSTADVRY